MKDFILLAPKTATQYQDMFWRIVDGQIFIGINYPTLFEGEGGDVPALSNWLNTVGVHKHKSLNLTKTYSKDKYPEYDNYPAIEVGTYKNIPVDYQGDMGVTTMILLRYNGDYDYEIVDGPIRPKLNGKTKFPRLIIRKKQGI